MDAAQLIRDRLGEDSANSFQAFEATSSRMRGELDQTRAMVTDSMASIRARYDETVTTMEQAYREMVGLRQAMLVHAILSPTLIRHGILATTEIQDWARLCSRLRLVGVDPEDWPEDPAEISDADLEALTEIADRWEASH